MKRCFQILFGFLFCISTTGQVPGQERNVTFAENKRYSVELSTTQVDTPLITVFKHADGDEKPTQVWSRALKSEDDDEDQGRAQGLRNTLMDPNQLLRSVSNDGKAVVLRPRYNFQQFPMLWVLTQAGRDKQFEADDVWDTLTEWDETEVMYSGQEGAQGLELFLEDEKPPIYAMWTATARQWLVVDLEKLTISSTETGLSARLDGLALPRARAIVRAHRPTGLKKLLKPVLESAAEWMPGMVSKPGGSSFYDNSNLEPAYRFLAKQKKPEDRNLIEQLLESEPQPFASGGAWGAQMFISVGLHSQERALGDKLLADWDGVGELEDDGELIGQFPNSGERLHRFASVSGRVQLPFGTPENSQGIWIYLIPASLKKDGWKDDESVLKVWYDPGFTRMQRPRQEQEPMDKLNFSFSSILPGEYRLKAVWDRRAPHTDPHNDPRGQKAMCIPSPGDYESAETEKLRLMAGKRITDIQLNCTNRVGEAAEYFAADELWKKKHPARPEKAFARGRRGPWKEKTLVTAPGKDWLTGTNENPGKIAVKRIQIRSREEGTMGLQGIEPTKRMVLTMSIPGMKQNHNGSLKAELVDEHGCSFESRGYSSSGRIYEMSFQTVPYGAKRIDLTVSREDYQNERGRPFENGPKTTVLASFVLTNLAQMNPAIWKPQDVPTTKDLDIVSVELSEFDPGNVEFAPQYGFNAPHMAYAGGGMVVLPGMAQPRSSNKLTFKVNGKPARGWHKLSGMFRDRWGNEAQALYGFCREEEVFSYVVRVARDPESGRFLPEEKFEINVEKIPGPGESLPLGMSKELQGLTFDLYSIGGTGEFTYRDGEMLSAKAEIEHDLGAYGPGGRVVESRLRLKDMDPSGRMGMDWMGGGMPREVTILSKIPHVACRVPDLGPDTLFGLVQQDTSVVEPMNAPLGPGRRRHDPNAETSEIQFLPLDYRAGDTDRKVTFVVQKARKVEFVVHVPKNSRQKPGQ